MAFEIDATGAAVATFLYAAGVVPGTNGDVTGQQMSMIGAPALDADADGTTSAV